jgi:hypothetical protein
MAEGTIAPAGMTTPTVRAERLFKTLQEHHKRIAAKLRQDDDPPAWFLHLPSGQPYRITRIAHDGPFLQVFGVNADANRSTSSSPRRRPSSSRSRCLPQTTAPRGSRSGLDRRSPCCVTRVQRRTSWTTRFSHRSRIFLNVSVLPVTAQVYVPAVEHMPDARKVIRVAETLTP